MTTRHLSPKINIIKESIIIANTGQEGMAQRFADVVENGYKNKTFKDKSAQDVVRLMSQLATQDFAATKAQSGQYGALVCFRSSKDGDTLCEFAVADFQPELKSKIWYCSMGSGQTVVDPLLGLFRKAYWADGPPNLSDGIFATTWALELAVELCPAYVAGPISVATLKKGKAKFLDDGDLDSHRENVAQAIKHFGNYRDSFKESDSSVPKPASPPTIS